MSMSDKQKAEFEKILRQSCGIMIMYGGIDEATKEVFHRVMKAAYNAGLRKGAESATVKPEDGWIDTEFYPVDKDSILKHLIP